ncbi:TetR/AcrR family transcriptional regulator [Croceicoccus sediminis]|uniref:TetR/AcrR family transcriptional regulator n=1 Tax=Croceicoccus sediminis TaxID=2571150 RepID=UPI001183F356|nr:TetR/AcrR family transcriptional regulator [Croceicoccus sediminis]
MPKSAASQVTRKPKQPRSQASLKRMMDAARQLLIERGGDEFTLQEVSKVGEVSIGSIYHRFESKEDLVRAVLGLAMSEMAEEERNSFVHVLKQSDNLASFVRAYVTNYSEILRDNALMLSLAMRQASGDPDSSREGYRREKDTADEMARGILHFESEIVGDAKVKAHLVFHITFATLARHLSLDSQDPMIEQQDWNTLVEGLCDMIVAYLTN